MIFKILILVVMMDKCLAEIKTIPLLALAFL